jgi:hypothetical protein
VVVIWTTVPQRNIHVRIDQFVRSFACFCFCFVFSVPTRDCGEVANLVRTELPDARHLLLCGLWWKRRNEMGEEWLDERTKGVGVWRKKSNGWIYFFPSPPAHHPNPNASHPSTSS